MAVRVLYFAALREALATGSESVALPAGVTSVAQLRDHLASRGGAWTAMAQTRNLRVAVNQTLAGPDELIRDGDEIAFFPPVTGG